jgi:hypothetical protein
MTAIVTPIVTAWSVVDVSRTTPTPRTDAVTTTPVKSAY